MPPSRSRRRPRGADVTEVTCPYCFESVQIKIDPGTEGTMVEDCEVCCRPWSLTVARDELTGELLVDVARAQ